MHMMNSLVMQMPGSFAGLSGVNDNNNNIGKDAVRVFKLE